MKSWSEETNKPYHLARTYLAITEQFTKKNLFACMNFFKKQDEATLNLLYEYLDSLDGKHKMNMTELFNNANRWNTQSKVKVVTETKTVDYLAILKGEKA